MNRASPASYPEDAPSMPLPQARVHNYRAFGLRISSEIPLPELTSAEFERPDVAIRRRPTAPDFASRTSRMRSSLGGHVQELVWPSAGHFRFIGNDCIEVEAAPGVDDRLLAFPLLGPAIALLLHLRGMMILHASAVSVGGQGVAFIGDKLAGKSTTAAAFLTRGHHLLTDDVLALTRDPDAGFTIQSAFPQIKLSPEASRVLDLQGTDAWPEVLPAFPKRQHRLRISELKGGIRPSHVFVLRRGSAAAIHALSETEVLGALLHNSYLKKYIAETFTPSAARRHLQQVCELAGQAKVSVLQVPDTVERLGEAVALVERFIEAAPRGKE